ncbi:hypothetical protein CLIB1423_07S05094 [[Candida] railenensis]|uniref:Cullin family profile domain-containing protein n=1 Tax=[Candida] railenensis TaxID=45579 RepID=A0A9P0QPT5_9ASCO|nr:hypothetical protein CLIB1423_07S05094 [[Candida] railenensis]
MEILDLGAPTPKSYTPSHLSVAKKSKRSSNSIGSSTTSLSSGTKSKEIPPKVLQQAESCKKDILEVIKLILEGKRLRHSYEWYYSSVERLCRFKPMEHSQISNVILEELKRYYNENVRPRIKVVLLGEGELNGKGPRPSLPRMMELSRGYLEVYEDWEVKLRTMTKVFLYLDRSYLKQHPVKMMIMEYGTRILIDDLTDKPSAVVDEALEGERGGDGSDRSTNESMSTAILHLASSLLHASRLAKFQDEGTTREAGALLSNLVKLNFKKEFPLTRIWIDKALIDHSVISKQVQKSYQMNPLQKPTYFYTYNSYLRAELKFMNNCGEPRSTQRQFKSKMKWCWIFKQLNSTLKLILPATRVDISGFSEDSVTKLEDVYDFCKEAQKEYSMDAPAVFFYEWNQNVYRDLENELDKTTSTTTPNSSIDAVISVCEKYETEIDKEKLSEEMYSKVQFETRNAFLNVFVNSPALNAKVITQLCSYCDTFFKQKRHQLSQQKAFKTTVLKVFNLLSNKSNFLLQYKRDLSRRLLFNKSIYLDLERELISEFCLVVGEDHNQDLIYMFEDLVQEHDRSEGGANTAINPIILKKEYWPDFPSYTRLDIRLPAELQSLLEGFNTMYIAKDERNNRKVLDWGYFNYHQVTIESLFNSGKKELIVNLLQASIILLFNTRSELTAKEVAELLEIELKNSQTGLLSLSTPKYPILAQTNSGAYRLNEDFSDKSTKIKIPFKGNIVHPHSSATASAQPEDPFDRLIAKNRTSELRALIARTMKQGRKMSYTTLLKATIDELEKKAGDGTISVSELKSNVEFLIDNGYISRSGDDLTYVP